MSTSAKISMSSQATPLLSDNESAGNTESETTDNRALAIGNNPWTTRSKACFMAITIVLFFTPTIWFWIRESPYLRSKETDTKTLVLVYVLTGIAGLPLFSIIQSITAYGAALLLLGSDAKAYLEQGSTRNGNIEDPEQRAKRKAITRRWQYWIFMVIFAYISCGLGEEALKYVAIILARKWGHVDNERSYLSVAVAAAFGFATLENILFTAAAYYTGESPVRLAVTVLERFALGALVHGMTAMLVAINVIARDVRHESMSLWAVLALPTFLHGTFDFVLGALCAYEGNIGWVHPKQRGVIYWMVGLVVTVLIALAVVLRSKMQAYDINY